MPLLWAKIESMAAWYQQWFDSPYYHKLYFERDEAEARAFIERLLRCLKPKPGSRMLDVACGRGRHSRMLATAGFDVTGTDLSPASITYASQFESDNLHFYQHDMRLPFWVNYFDYAFNFFTSFGYFATRREHDAAVRSLSQSLKPDGLLLFDYLNVPFAEAHLQPNEVKTIDAITFEIHRWQDSTHFYKRIRIWGAELQQPLEFTEKVVKFGIANFKEMLNAQKMQVTAVFGDYKLQNYDGTNSPRLILLARKASG